MTEKYLIETVRWIPECDNALFFQIRQELRSNHAKELVLLPDPAQPNIYIGLVLSEYYTPALSDSVMVKKTQRLGTIYKITILRSGVGAYFSSLVRNIHGQKNLTSNDAISQNDDPLEKLFGTDEIDNPFDDEPQAPPQNPYLAFLREKSPARIEQELNNYVIGQPDLTKAVADFLYYHILRQEHPDLPQRPLMIAGPSGSGKTEVWRVAQKLYGDLLYIRIIDGSNISCEGWSGNYKLNTYVNTDTPENAILVFDEFDKLVRPKHNSYGDNVSMDIQAEFLKLFEGEYALVSNRKAAEKDTKKMGFVLVGAFEELRSKKEQAQTKKDNSIGFCSSPKVQKQATSELSRITDEDYIRYGLMPELVGRISSKCFTVPLSDQVYLDILHSPNSRVAKIEQVLKSYGAELEDVLSKETLLEMVSQSKSNKTGVRWVCAQVESRLLEAIREQGLFPAA